MTGTVEEVLLRPGPGGATGLHLALATDAGDVEVLVGPTFYVESQGLEVGRGDEVTVTGSRFTADGTAILMAREITVGDLTVQLRDEGGMPMWRGQGPRSQTPDEATDADGQGEGTGHACCPGHGRMGETAGTGDHVCRMHGDRTGR